MEKFRKENMMHIYDLVQAQTGAQLSRVGGKPPILRIAIIAATVMCFLALSGFAYSKVSSLAGDEVGFWAVYQGDGVFDVAIINDSDKELKMQENVKIRQWSTGTDVEGDPKKIRCESEPIAPHSTGVMTIDLSQGYDIEQMQTALKEGDYYYFILTNNNFLFGQDWMCSFDFREASTQKALESLEKRMEVVLEEPEPQATYSGGMREDNWAWPTQSQTVSTGYGDRIRSGTVSDHINIAGAMGDAVYAIADGVVLSTGFDSVYGQTVTLDLGDGVQVLYGHLQESSVREGDPVSKGDVIGQLGSTGMATGACLLLKVSVDGEAVNPLGKK